MFLKCCWVVMHGGVFIGMEEWGEVLPQGARRWSPAGRPLKGWNGPTGSAMEGFCSLK